MERKRRNRREGNHEKERDHRKVVGMANGLVEKMAPLAEKRTDNAEDPQVVPGEKIEGSDHHQRRELPLEKWRTRSLGVSEICSTGNKGTKMLD